MNALGRRLRRLEDFRAKKANPSLNFYSNPQAVALSRLAPAELKIVEAMIRRDGAESPQHENERLALANYQTAMRQVAEELLL